jgi:hypothetical protein
MARKTPKGFRDHVGKVQGEADRKRTSEVGRRMGMSAGRRRMKVMGMRQVSTSRCAKSSRSVLGRNCEGSA